MGEKRATQAQEGKEVGEKRAAQEGKVGEHQDKARRNLKEKFAKPKPSITIIKNPLSLNFTI